MAEFQFEDGSLVTVNRISPVIVQRARREGYVERPEVPFSEFKMPDGSVRKEANPGSSVYKESMKEWNVKLRSLIATRVVTAGIDPASAYLLENRTPEELEALAYYIISISMPTPDSVRSAMEYSDASVVEGIVAARWADYKIDDFWRLSVDVQNLIVAAFRRSIAINMQAGGAQ